MVLAAGVRGGDSALEDGKRASQRQMSPRLAHIASGKASSCHRACWLSHVLRGGGHIGPCGPDVTWYQLCAHHACWGGLPRGRQRVGSVDAGVLVPTCQSRNDAPRPPQVFMSNAWNPRLSYVTGQRQITVANSTEGANLLALECGG